MLAHEWAAQRLGHLRKRADDMTLEEFGQAMGDLGYPMSRQTVWKIERGDRPLTLDELFAAAHVLGVSPVALVAPDPDGEFTVTDDGVPAKRQQSMDASTFGDWWLSVSHPREDVTGDDMDASRPRAVAHLFESYELLALTNETYERVMAQAVAALPPEQRGALRFSNETTDKIEEGRA